MRYIYLIFSILFILTSCNNDVESLRYGKNLLSIDSTLQGNGTVISPLGVDTTFILSVASPTEKIYRAKLSFENNNSFSVLNTYKNTLGITPSLSYSSPGEYILTATGLFVDAKTSVMVSPGLNDYYATAEVIPPNQIVIHTVDPSIEAPAAINLAVTVEVIIEQ